MRRNRSEVLLDAHGLEFFKNIVAQPSKSDSDPARFERPCQYAQRCAGRGVYARNNRAIDNQQPGAIRRIGGHVEDAAADVLGIEIQPRARAVDHDRTQRISGVGISRPIDELAGQRLSAKKGHARSSRMRDEHDQRAGRGEKKAIEQSEKQHAEKREQSDTKFAQLCETQPAQIVELNQV